VIMDTDKLKRSHRPIDRVAGRVVHGKAEHWNPVRWQGSGECLDVQPLMTEVPPFRPNYTGIRMGSLVVLGYSASQRVNDLGSGKWVCRCDCGMFTIRKGSSILLQQTKPNESPPSCSRCVAKRKIREGR